MAYFSSIRYPPPRWKITSKIFLILKTILYTILDIDWPSWWYFLGFVVVVVAVNRSTGKKLDDHGWVPDRLRRSIRIPAVSRKRSPPVRVVRFGALFQEVHESLQVKTSGINQILVISRNRLFRVIVIVRLRGLSGRNVEQGVEVRIPAVRIRSPGNGSRSRVLRSVPGPAEIWRRLPKLRPLVPALKRSPWGIFFGWFGPKPSPPFFGIAAAT